MWWIAIGCVVPPDPGIQIGATGTAPDPIPGGAQLWLAGGVTGLAPVPLWATGDERCGADGAVAQIDGDGVPDLVLRCTGQARRTATTPSDHVRVWSGAAAGQGYVAPVGVPVDVEPGGWFGALPDLDGDGADEILVGAQIVAGGALLAAQDVRWPTPGDGTVRAADAGDHDGDGVADLVVAEDGALVVVSGATVPADADPVRSWPGVFEAVTALGDVDGDALPDLAAVAGGDVTVLLGDGGAVTLPTGPGTMDVVAPGDLDGDGRDDVVLSFRAPGAWTGWISGADLEGAPRVLHDAAGVVACDVDGDGVRDLLTPLGWFPGAGLAAGATAVETSAGSAVVAGVCAGDLDGDGRGDMVVPTLFPAGAAR